jgi:XTP/dITP diphosphohydrolase
MPLSLPPGARLVVATHNPGKAVEIAALLEDRYETVSAVALGLPEPEETETTYVGNAVLKARAAADAANLPAIADDSGMGVAALGGAPGVYSANWAGEPRDFGAAMARVEREVAATGGGDRRAWFVCALAVAWPRGPVLAVEGRVDGALVFPGRGTRGFGYDPIFLPDGFDVTTAELSPEQKNAISHRGRAFQALAVDLAVLVK